MSQVKKINKKPKKRLKKWVKNLLRLFLFIIFISIFYFIFKDKVLNLFSKDKSINSNTEIVSDQGFPNDPFSQLFRMRLPSQNLDYATSSNIEENGDMKIYLLNTKDNSGYIYVNTHDDPSYIWITFVSAIAEDTLKSYLIKDLKNFEYIDLRFGNKVFYKFYDSSIKLSSSTTTFSNIATSSNISSTTNNTSSR